jgi:hypothetical protein
MIQPIIQFQQKSLLKGGETIGLCANRVEDFTHHAHAHYPKWVIDALEAICDAGERFEDDLNKRLKNVISTLRRVFHE